MAAKMLDNTEPAGKTVSPGNIAYYTIQHIKSGRWSTGSSVVDVHASRTQLNTTTRLTSLEDPNFIGSDILIQIRRQPNWKDSPVASARSS
jgi:hypothetical protein